MKIVQVGTNNSLDDCHKYVINHKDEIEKVYLIEPLSMCNPHIKEAYKNIKNFKIFNIAISPVANKKVIKMFVPTNISKIQHSSINRQHLTAHNHESIFEIEVECFTLDEFFKLNNITECDRLYIDAEGSDCEILLNFNLDKFDIKYIEFEHLHADGYPRINELKGEVYKPCVEKLKQYGYSVKKKDRLNTIAEKL